MLIRGASKINITLLTELPLLPVLRGRGIGNAIIGTIVVTTIAAIVAIPVGVGGGIYLAEYSRSGGFSPVHPFWNKRAVGVPSIIAGVVIYGTIVTSRIVFGNAYSALAEASPFQF